MTLVRDVTVSETASWYSLAASALQVIKAYTNKGDAINLKEGVIALEGGGGSIQ